MQLAMIGLGRMGGNMVERLMRHGHKLVVFDRSAEAVAKYEALGATRARTISPTVVQALASAARHLDHGAGRRSGRRDDRRRSADALGRRHHHRRRQLELPRHDSPRRGARRSRRSSSSTRGTSGGIWGLENGYCLMVGGSDAAVKHCEPIFTALAPEDGYAHVGPDRRRATT